MLYIVNFSKTLALLNRVIRRFSTYAGGVVSNKLTVGEFLTDYATRINVETFYVLFITLMSVVYPKAVF